NLSNVMYPVVRHGVALTHILRAGAVAGDQDSDASGMSDLVVDDAVVQAGEIEAQARSARVDEPAGLNGASPRAPQTHERARPIKVFPLVLEFPWGAPMPRQSFAASESQPSEHEARHGLVDGPA